MSDEQPTKHCCHCQQNFPLSFFYRDSRSSDGFFGSCKACHNDAVHRYEQTTKGKIARNKATANYRQTEQYKLACLRRRHTPKGKTAIDEYRRSPAGRLAHRRNQSRYRKLYPEKVAARFAVRKAIKQGKLLHPSYLSCVICPNQAAEYHHHRGYDIEHHLDVIPVCYDCHVKVR